MPARSTISPELKRQVVEKLLRGETTVAEVAKEHNLHPYQIQAWVGQMTLKQGPGKDYTITAVRRGKAAETVSSDTGAFRLLHEALTGDSEEEDPVRAIGEWYIRTHVLKEPPKGKPVK